MKSKVQSFSFLMELIIVILFFAASSTICASFIVQAKNKQTAGSELQNSLIEAQSMIATMQAYPQKEISELFTVKKIDQNLYQKDNLVIEIMTDEVVHGTITIKNGDQTVSELPFVLGGSQNE